MSDLDVTRAGWCLVWPAQGPPQSWHGHQSSAQSQQWPPGPVSCLSAHTLHQVTSRGNTRLMENIVRVWCIPICPSFYMSFYIIGIFYNWLARNKLFWSWMLKIVSIDSSVHPDSNDVKISHNISKLGSWIKYSSSQEIKLNICQTIIASYYVL